MNIHAFNFMNIPREEVPYDYTDLEHMDMIENIHNQRLVYLKNEFCYQYVNNDVTLFISEDQMLSPWYKILSPWQKI